MQLQKGMRIAIFLPTMAFGGTERVVLNLLNNFVNRQNLTIDLILLRAEGEFLAEVPKEINVISFDVSREHQAVVPLMRYLKEKRPDILMSHYCHLSAILGCILSQTNCKNVVVCHNVVELDIKHSHSGLIRKYLCRILFKRSRLIVAVSQTVAASLAHNYNLMLSDIAIVNNPIDEKFFCGLEWDQKKQVNNIPMIVAAGRLVKEKNFLLLIESFNVLRKTTFAKLIILGEGEERGHLECAIKKYSLEADVSMPGFVSDPASFMKKAGVVVITSESEGFGYVALEALACGCPVVSTDCGGISEILTDYRHGRIVPGSDCNVLATAIQEILETPVDKEFLIEHAKKFSTPHIAEKYLALMEKVIE